MRRDLASPFGVLVLLAVLVPSPAAAGVPRIIVAEGYGWTSH